MITPRQTRLVRVPDLHAFRTVTRRLSSSAFIVVPTSAAARQLARSLPPESCGCVTRDGLYDLLARRLPDPSALLKLFERDAIMQAAARASARGVPFSIRPGLVSEMVRFYDLLRRQSQTVTRFDELMTDALSGGDGADRGAERLLAQTTFLAAAFRDYERRVEASGACDEHALRQHLMTNASKQPVSRLVVTVADWIADPDGLHVADFDLLARLPLLASIDFVVTEGVLRSGFHERLHAWLPGIEEVTEGTNEPPVRPRLITPATAQNDEVWLTCRDREEEMIAIGRRIASDDRTGATAAVVFKRPLPYLYLARDTFGPARIAYEAADALPLAAAPVASIVDLILEAIETKFTRTLLVDLLRSPHLIVPGEQYTRAAVSALDRALSARRYLGEAQHLEGLFEGWQDEQARPALQAARALVRALAPLLEPAPASVQLDRLVAFFDAHLRPLDLSRPIDVAEARVRDTLRRTLTDLAAAHRTHHDVEWGVDDLAAAVRRAIGDQTDDAPIETAGARVQLVDDRAARYLDCADMTIVGLVENDWPEKPRRNIFYSTSMLKVLGWPSEKDRRAAADARFLDLLASASDRVYLSTITLDDETLVSRSAQLDEMPRARLSTATEGTLSSATIFPEEALIAGDATWPGLGADTRESLTARLQRTAATDAAFHGGVGPRPPRAWSVSALETYLDCPFKFFARHVLRLDEEPEDEEVMDPRRRGQFVHDVFERFFRAWQRDGHDAITPDNIGAARRLFAEIVEESLERVPPSEAGLERTRLMGSPAAAGLGESVFRMEAERPVPVVDRKLEFELQGNFTFQTDAGERTVAIKGKADRLDLLADGTFRLIDYKLGWPPKRDRALQLPIYGLCAQQRLSPTRALGEAMYVAFKGPRRVVPLFTNDAARDDVLRKAQQRLADTIDAIDRGEFPPAPDDVFRCETCSFAAVCRKDYV